MSEPVEQFRAAMRAAGLEPPDVIEPGVLHRFSGIGKRSGNTAGWCKLFEDGLGGVFGCWASGLFEAWQANRPHSPAEREAFKRHVAEARAQADADRKARQAEAKATADAVWQAAAPAPDDHPYLRAKGVKAHGLRARNGELVAPIRNGAELHSLQFIGPDGSKRFLPGGRVAGCYFSIGSPQGALIVAEGFATAASIHEATGHAVAVAFTAGNLKAVARALRQKFPDLPLILCADDDAATEGNPGLSAAREAAQAVGGLLAVPDFGADRPEGATDFNDLAAARGLEAVKRAVANATDGGGPPPPGDETAPERWPQPLDLREMAQREPEPPAMIITDWLPAGYATLLAGHGGAGKSGIALQLAAAIATGRDWCGLPVAERRVLYLSCEDRAAVIHWRLRRICDHAGLSMDSLAERLDVLDLVGRDTILYGRTGLTSAYHELARRIEKSEVIFIDGVTDTYGADENDRAEVKQFINALLALIRADRGAVLLVAHVNKASASASATSEGYSGSTGWHNAVRARWYLRREAEGTGDLLLELQKSNHGAINQTIRFRWDDRAHLFNGWLEGASAFDRRERDELERDGILAALREVVASGGYCPAATSGPRTAFNVLSAAESFPESLRAGDVGKRRFWRHIEALRLMQQVAEASIRRGNRHKVATLVPKACADNDLDAAPNAPNALSDIDATMTQGACAPNAPHASIAIGAPRERAHGECPRCLGDGDCYCGAP